MHSKTISLLSALLISTAAQAQTVHTIITCPSEDTSKEMKISWASETAGTYVVFSPTEGGKGAYNVIVKPEMETVCSVYNGNPSRAADGTNMDENVEFLKCGATLSGLKSNTGYVYHICGADGTRLSDDHYFKTSGARRWSATVISDIHHYTPLPDRLAKAMAMTRTLKDYDRSTDWVLHLGDVTAWGGSQSFWRTLYREPLFSSTMVAGLNGNHDNMTRANGQSGDFFRYANYLPDNGYSGQEGICYFFRYSDVLFIMLNSEIMRTEEGLKDAREWVTKVISQQRGSQDAPGFVVVCEHYQWFFGKDGATSQFSRWHDLFDDLGVDLALGANNHIYVRSHPIMDSKPVSAKKGTVYLQTTSSDNERGEGMEDSISKNEDLIAARWTEGGQTVSGLNMKVSPSRITVSLLDRTGKVCDKVTIVKKHRKNQ